jgi:hypothetical protein
MIKKQQGQVRVRGLTRWVSPRFWPVVYAVGKFRPAWRRR